MAEITAKLYVVGTPIGNLSDLSPRAQETLANVDFIAAEDTRVTLKLLNNFGIKTPLESYHEHNKSERGGEIVQKILSGKTCALVTDAGMPAISDPGEDLVRLCRQAGVAVESVPGPTAFATAMAISGMPSCRFTFEGFLSVNKKSRSLHLASIKNEPRTMIFYEAPHKLRATLKDLYNTLGDREIAICRELTKIHEEVRRTTLGEAAREIYEQARPQGEFVLIIAGKPKDEVPAEYTLKDALIAAEKYMSEGLSASGAAKAAALDTGIKKGDIYKELIENSAAERNGR